MSHISEITGWDHSFKTKTFLGLNFLEHIIEGVLLKYKYNVQGWYWIKHGIIYQKLSVYFVFDYTCFTSLFEHSACAISGLKMRLCHEIYYFPFVFRAILLAVTSFFHIQFVKLPRLVEKMDIRHIYYEYYFVTCPTGIDCLPCNWCLHINSLQTLMTFPL